MENEENIIRINLPKYSEGYISGVEAFLQNAFPKFAIGEHRALMGIIFDIFSYTVFMEHVKEDLQYSGIGGIYVNKGIQSARWQKVTNDAELNALIDRVNSGDHMDFYVDTVVDSKTEPLKQMQPHVVIRPRHNIFTGIKYINYIKYGLCIQLVNVIRVYHSSDITVYVIIFFR